MHRNDNRYREQLRGIQQKVTALAAGSHTGPATALVAGLLSDVETLQAWTDPAPTLDPGQFLLDDVVAALNDLDISAYVEHTGGGVATIYAAPRDNGRPVIVPFGDAGVWPVLAGPGTYSPAGPTGDLADFTVQGNTDVFGDDEPYWAAGSEDTVATITEAIAARVRSLGPLRTYDVTWTESTKTNAPVTTFSPTHAEMAARTGEDQTYAQLEQAGQEELRARLAAAAIQTPLGERATWVEERDVHVGREVIGGVLTDETRPAILPTSPVQA